MRLPRVLWAISLLVASGALVAGYIRAGRWPIALLILALALAWEISRRLVLRWLGVGLFVAYYAAALLGLGWFAWPGWSWIALPFCLAIWDLVLFDWRFQSAMLVVNEKQLAYRHVARLLVVLAVGAIFSLFAVVTQVNLSFGVAILLGALVVLGLIQGVNLLKRAE